MKGKQYYLQRTGKIDNSPLLDLALLKRLFLTIYNQLFREDYYQKYFGFHCVDQGEVYGILGSDIDTAVFFNLRKDDLWPIHDHIEKYSEDDLFAMMEFLHDHCSKPLEGDYHSWNDCGWHYSTFDDEQGQRKFRDKVNVLLGDYLTGFELSSNGEILNLPDSNLCPLLDAIVPSNDKENINTKIDVAVSKFRKHKASLDDRKNALRELADVLEYLRPNIKEALMSNDEKEVAEHTMLVDLGRNDLGRVSDYGSVKVGELMSIERYSHVQHLVTSLRSRLRDDLDRFDALRSCFPAGTVTGAPKIRAMQIIDELEPAKRGVYAGAVLYVDYADNLDSCIAIRTIHLRDGVATVQAGAGIVADSVPEREYEECVNKARALFRAIELAERGL